MLLFYYFRQILVLTLRRCPSLPNNVSSTSGCSPSQLSLLLSSQMLLRNVIPASLRPPMFLDDSRRPIARTSCFRKQLNDLGRQVQTLLKEIARRQDPAIPSDEELEADKSTVPVENIDEVITNNLVLFRSIPALQAQNQKLLGIVHEMGAKMEAEECKYREALEKEQGARFQSMWRQSLIRNMSGEGSPSSPTCDAPLRCIFTFVRFASLL
jgi:hypothetical protein